MSCLSRKARRVPHSRINCTGRHQGTRRRKNPKRLCDFKFPPLSLILQVQLLWIRLLVSREHQELSRLSQQQPKLRLVGWFLCVVPPSRRPALKLVTLCPVEQAGHWLHNRALKPACLPCNNKTQYTQDLNFLCSCLQTDISESAVKKNQHYF